MNEDDKQQAFMSALVTEHFVLQSARGVATSEASGRAALYLTSVTGALVALGFVAQVGEQFDAFAAAVLPAVFLLGEFTYVRLLENSIEDVLFHRSIQRIRRYYLGLVPEAAAFFGDADVDRKPSAAMYRSSAQLLFTAASMVAAINAILGGAGVTLLVRALDLAGLGVAVLAGVAVAVLVFGLHLWHQRRRFAQMIDRPAAADAGTVTPSQPHRP
jgi:hypothetical protein